MKKSVLLRILSVEAIVCLLIAFFDKARVAPSLIFYFPFLQITSLLRRLSLSGMVGNIVAIAIYVALSLIPIVVLRQISKKRTLLVEDHLLILLSLVCFVGFYSMINTPSADPFSGNESLINPFANLPEVKNIIYSTLMYSVLLGYFALRLLRIFFSVKTKELHRYLAWMLSGFAIFSLAAIILSFVAPWIADLQNLHLHHQLIYDLNTPDGQLITSGPDMTLYANIFFSALRAVVHALPYAADIYLVLLALDLLEEIQIARYSEKVVELSQNLSLVAARALSLIIGVHITFNILQVIFVDRLFNVKAHAFFPILSILFVLGLLIFSQYIQEGKALKDDNDLFV
ncbi:MAG: hypothetical protein Q4D77_07815 [Peptostreptococcaceae bacterium]|nr:hypothetical protein [Peptostreptococcaceae bacterium]